MCLKEKDGCVTYPVWLAASSARCAPVLRGSRCAFFSAPIMNAPSPRVCCLVLLNRDSRTRNLDEQNLFWLFWENLIAMYTSSCICALGVGGGIKVQTQEGVSTITNDAVACVSIEASHKLSPFVLPMQVQHPCFPRRPRPLPWHEQGSRRAPVRGVCACQSALCPRRDRDISARTWTK